MKYNSEALQILLVDDDDIDVETVKRAFKKNKVVNPVHVAGDGLEALEYLRQNHGDPQIPLPRVVLLDLNMPRMNGIEFLQEVRKDPVLKNLNVFVLTTSDEDKDKIAAYNLNVAGYILKPVDFYKFADAIQTLNTYWALCEHITENPNA